MVAKQQEREGQELQKIWHKTGIWNVSVRDRERWAWAWWRGWEVPVNLKEVQSPDSRADVT